MHMEVQVRTTIDLPQTLVEEAMKVSHQRTKTAVIVAALEDFVRKGKIQGLKKFNPCILPFLTKSSRAATITAVLVLWCDTFIASSTRVCGRSIVVLT